jgi:phospholipid transport system substrate-binding protein
MRLRSLSVGILLVLACALPAAAQGLDPESLIKQVTREVLEEIRRDKALQSGDREKAMRLAEEKVLPHVDFREATRLALGKAWPRASEQQRARLVAEFRSMLVRTYSNAISAYRGQIMEVQPVRMRPGDTEVTVRNHYLRPGARPVAVDYAMHRTADGWKVYDFVVEGISLVMTYRSEFGAILGESDIDGLIERLAEKNAPAPEQSRAKPNF